MRTTIVVHSMYFAARVIYSIIKNLVKRLTLPHQVQILLVFPVVELLKARVVHFQALEFTLSSN